MSGIEVAGLVLGAFPVVMSALETYRDVFTSLKSWWEFQRTFEEFVDDVGIQRALFDNNIEKLLAPFIESEHQMGLLLADPFGPAWRDPELDNHLRVRLGSSFHFYQSIVSRMNDTLLDLQRILGIESGQAVHLWTVRKPGRIEAKLELRRMRISFSKQKFHHVDTLSKRNDELSKLLQSSDELAPMRRKRLSSPDITFLQQLRKNALSLHGVLGSAWSCSCEPVHAANLRLEKRIVQRTVVNDNWKIVVPSTTNSVSQPASTELEVKINNNHGTTENALIEEGIQGLSVTGTIVSPRDAFAQRLSWISMSGSATTATSLKSRSNYGSKSSFLTASSPGIPKRVSFADCTSSIDSVLNTSTITTTPTSQHPSPIADMCAALRSMSHETACLGILEDPEKRQHVFYPMPTSSANHHTLTLATALRPTSSTAPFKTMSRQDRFTIAVTLASSLLQVHTTPWVGRQWNKNDIVLHADIVQQRIVPKPLLHAEFPSTAVSNTSQSNQPASPKFNTKKALSDLGIMLLELCFGKAVEDHPLRRQFFGANDQPNAFTDISTAREWHEDVLGELGDDMSDAIRRCLDCSFAPKPNFEDKDFQEAVFQGVVLPLQDVLKVWEKT